MVPVDEENQEIKNKNVLHNLTHRVVPQILTTNETDESSSQIK